MEKGIRDIFGLMHHKSHRDMTAGLQKAECQQRRDRWMEMNSLLNTRVGGSPLFEVPKGPLPF